MQSVDTYCLPCAPGNQRFQLIYDLRLVLQQPSALTLRNLPTRQ
jgi:hypothetical protein